MNDCCGAPPVVDADRAVCPACGTRGSAIDLLTVKALLNAPALSRLVVATFHFCAAPSCPAVYFAADGQTFVTSDLRVPVWQKEAEGSRTICYCFGENEAGIRREIERDGSSQAEARVREHIAAKRCACEVRNPRGVCCLGDVAAAVKRAR